MIGALLHVNGFSIGTIYIRNVGGEAQCKYEYLVEIDGARKVGTVLHARANGALELFRLVIEDALKQKP